MSSIRTRQLLLMTVLACGVVAVYGQVYSHGFVEYDDPGYVSDNPFVRRGLTWEEVRWAFTTHRLGNWNPLTWLSHMLDVQLFGLNPGAHHLVNVGLHLANTVLLFRVLQRMTGALWPSFIVAALFAVHPLHVESVAWISERKDVLSTLFLFLTLWVYARYVEARSRRWLAAALALFALGLMAKPMLVTLPFVLLLLDWWPLRRSSWFLVPGLWFSDREPRTGNQEPETTNQKPVFLLAEKLPFFLLTALFSGLAYVTQVQSGAVAHTDAVPLGARVANALVAYVHYLIKTVWPAELAVLYPFAPRLPLWQSVGAALVLTVVSLFLLRSARRHPYALVGWLWYLGTLVPVIGLVQIGSQALADRYTYVPLIGVFVMLAWGGQYLCARLVVPVPVVAAVITAVIGAYAAVAWTQVAIWKSGESLLSHAVNVTRDNCIAHNNLGVALGVQGKTEAAMAHYREALRIKPDYADAYNNIALALWRQGRRDEAVTQYNVSLRYAPDSVETHTNLGLVLTEQGKLDQAIAHLSEAVRLDPTFVAAHINLGNALRGSGRTQEALAQFDQALRIQPDNANAYNNIGAILADQGRREEAAAQFRTALRYSAQSADAWNNLGLILGQLGKTDEAITHFAEAIRLAPEQADIHTNLANALRDDGRQQEAIEHYEQALRLQPDLPDAHHRLGVALMTAGQQAQAIEQFQQALHLNPAYAEAHNDLGVALFNSGQLAEAIGHFEKALQLNPGLGDAQINLDVARTMAQ